MGGGCKSGLTLSSFVIMTNWGVWAVGSGECDDAHWHLGALHVSGLQRYQFGGENPVGEHEGMLNPEKRVF